MKRVGGGKRRGGKRASIEQDDRPRGYEAQRMRQVWRDIDHAKHKAGLGEAPEPTPASTWGVVGVIGRVSALAGEAAAWVTATAPAACALVASGAALLRGVPVVGWLVELAPGHDGGNAAAGRKGASNGGGRHHGHTAPIEPHEGEPNGHWVD